MLYQSGGRFYTFGKCPRKKKPSQELKEPIKNGPNTSLPKKHPESTQAIKSEAQPIESVKIEPKTIGKKGSSSPIITSDLDSLINKIKIEEGNKKSNLKWNLENLKRVWNEYKERVKSSSTRSALENVILNIDGKNIQATVPSTFIQEKIIVEKGLQLDLRSNFHDDLSISYIVNIDLFPNYQTVPTKKVLSDEEKYKIMLEKNQHLSTLVSKFDLKLDKR